MPKPLTKMLADIMHKRMYYLDKFILHHIILPNPNPLQTFHPKKKYILELDPGCEPKPKPKTKINSEFYSIHFGIEINKL